MEEKTIYPEIPSAPNPMYDKITEDFLQLVNDFWVSNQTQFDECKLVLAEKDLASGVDDPTVSNKRSNPAILHNAIHKLVEQTSLPSFQLYAAEASEGVRATMQGLSEDILRQAGWERVLTNKKTGCLRSMLEIGDAVIGFSYCPDNIFPIQYYREETDRYFVNSDAVELRNAGSEKEVRKRVVVKEYQWEQAIALYPELEGNADIGALPCWGDIKSFRFSELQESLVKQRRIQIAYCVDLDFVNKSGKKGYSCIIAGANKYKFNEKEGEKYIDRDKYGNAILPEGHIVCFPRSTGFWNYGFLQLLYKLGVMHSKLLNMGITYTLANSNPVRVIATSLPEEEVTSRMARAMRNGAEGKLPIMVAADGKEFGGVSTTAAPAIINEANMLIDLIEKQMGQMGVNINNIMTDNTKTLGALQLEVAAATGIIKYIQDNNASEYEFLIENGLEMLARRTVDDSNIPLVTSVKIRTEEGKNEEVLGVPERDEMGRPVRKKNGQVKIFRSFNLQDFKDLWNTYEWKVIVAGGVVNNPVLEDEIDRSIQQSFPNTSAARKAASAMYQRHGRNYIEDDFGMEQPQGQLESTNQIQ